MMSMFRVFVALLGLALLTGCAGFRSGETADLGDWPPAQQEKPSLRYVVQGKMHHNGNPAAVPPVTLKAWSDIVGKAYTDSGLFSSVAEGFGDADVLAEVKITNNGNGSMALAFLCGFTFGAIPATAKEQITTETTYRDRQGNVLGELKKQDGIRMWMHILLLPGALIANPFSQLQEVYYDNNKATILTGREQGLF